MCYVWFELENFILEEARVSREDTICFEGNEIRVRLMCALRAHIKLSIFRNILSGIEKAVITFSIFEKIFPKNGK